MIKLHWFWSFSLKKNKTVHCESGKAIAKSLYYSYVSVELKAPLFFFGLFCQSPLGYNTLAILLFFSLWLEVYLQLSLLADRNSLGIILTTFSKEYSTWDIIKDILWA